MSESPQNPRMAATKDKQKPSRLKPEHVEWCADLARAAKVSFAHDEIYGMSEDEGATRDEMDAERDAQDEAFGDFARMDELCKGMEVELELLVGKADLPKPMPGASRTELQRVSDLAAAARADLLFTKPDAASAKLLQLNKLIAGTLVAIQDRPPLLVVGGPDASATMLAGGNFDRVVYDAAMTVLRKLQDNRTGFLNVGEILDEVRKNPEVQKKQAEVELVRQEKEKADEERTASDDIYDLRSLLSLREPLIIKSYDIKNGTWRPISGRTNGDHELVFTLSGRTISLHVHAPDFSGRRWIKGAIMVDGRNPHDEQVPDALIDAIMKTQMCPRGW